MRLIVFLFSTALLTSSACYGALPPAWEGVREIKAILDAPDLNQHLDSSEVINGIYREDEGWVIQTSRSEIHVKVESLPQSIPGPVKFHLTFKKLGSPQSGTFPH